MTVVIETPAAQPVFTGRSRWAAALLVTVGAGLQVVEFVLEPNSTPDPAKGRELGGGPRADRVVRKRPGSWPSRS